MQDYNRDTYNDGYNDGYDSGYESAYYRHSDRLDAAEKLAAAVQEVLDTDRIPQSFPELSAICDALVEYHKAY